MSRFGGVQASFCQYCGADLEGAKPQCPLCGSPQQPGASSGSLFAPPPPFSVLSILELSWGLTLSLSHEEGQRSLGKAFTDRVMKGLEAAGKNPDPKTKWFLDNLTMALSKTARDLGFVRDTHVRKLDYNVEEYVHRQKVVNDLRSASVTTAEGVLTKVSSGLGLGTLAGTLASKFPEFGNPYFLFLTAIFFGVLGSFIIPQGVAWRLDSRLEDWKNKKKCEQEKYWRETFKPEMAKVIRHFHNDVVYLVQCSFEKYWQANQRRPEFQTKEDATIEDKKKNDATHDWLDDFIRDRILPSDTLEWPLYPSVRADVSSLSKPTAKEKGAKPPPKA